MTTRRFLYWRDPLCLSCFGLYWLNRLLIKPMTPAVFFHSYFNDLICLPCFLPLALFVSRKIGLRRCDGPPTAFELVVYWITWSIYFEVIGPRLPALYPKTVGDPMDVLAYAVGTALGAMVWWSPIYQRLISRMLPKQQGRPS
jgi:hypothetical protein